MASTEPMEDDSFRSRVDKIFGSLTGRSEPLPINSSDRPSLWSLTGDEVEKREWRRDSGSFDRDELPCSDSFDGLFSKCRQNSRRSRKLTEEDDLVDEDEEDQPPDHIDEWEIRSSIGLDPTLENEEEEDEYDKVASGTENAGDRLYMKDVTDYGKYLNAENILSNSFNSSGKDHRANHLAARNRLKEDDAEAQEPNDCDNSNMEVEEPQVTIIPGDDVVVRSILKRKNTDAVSKSPKRVKFDPGCIFDKEVKYEGFSSISSDDDISDRAQNNYTHYNLSWSSELDQESNTGAFMDFLKFVKSSKISSELDNVLAELPKSITFIPKRKAVNGGESCNDVKRDKEHGYMVSIAADESHQVESSAVEETEPERSANVLKPIRKYRMKSSLEDMYS